MQLFGFRPRVLKESCSPFNSSLVTVCRLFGTIHACMPLSFVSRATYIRTNNQETSSLDHVAWETDRIMHKALVQLTLQTRVSNSLSIFINSKKIICPSFREFPATFNLISYSLNFFLTLLGLVGS